MAFAVIFWLGLAAAVVAAVVVGWRARRGVLITGVALITVAVVWIAAKVANDRDYRDADGWVDCWPSCTALQRGVGVSLVGGAVLGAALALAFVIALVRRGGRH
jgi:hypothetical protein